tara:strand:+ start:96161 stop:97474 length:1314 start_codon:yes stop_codon:yes gene_type:complete
MVMNLEQHFYQDVPREQIFKQYGRIFKASNFLVEAKGLTAKIGTLCQVQNIDGSIAYAETVGFKGEITYLMSYEELSGLSPSCQIVQLNQFPTKPYGEGLLGRVVDAYGHPLDQLGPLQSVLDQHDYSRHISPLSKARIKEPLDIGIKAINGLLTVGIGQRIGLMAGSGVGKSVLLGMMAKHADVDVIVIGLIGERSREVREFIEDNVKESMGKMVMVVATADTSPLNRIQAAEYASSVAEHFRDQNKNVLLLMDSLTRYAQAIRELGLSLGEPPTTKGYPPSVFTKIPKLVERVGNGEDNSGSITGIYTVLAESDDIQDPIIDCARSILDGHIVLSRHLAEQGHFPAIDIEQSISRVMGFVIDQKHAEVARLFKIALQRYNEQKDFIAMGTYQEGLDPAFDTILKRIPHMNQFLQQTVGQQSHFTQDVAQLLQVMS